MYRKASKIGILVSVVLLTLYLCRANTLVACIAAFYVAGNGIISFDRRKALVGDGQNPGILPISTIALPLGSAAVLVGIPYLFNQAGYYDSWMFDWASVVAALIAGLMLAAYLWIPFLLYWIVDLVFNRYANHQAEVPTV